MTLARSFKAGLQITNLLPSVASATTEPSIVADATMGSGMHLIPALKDRAKVNWPLRGRALARLNLAGLSSLLNRSLRPHGSVVHGSL
jgi:hypothetical protein